MSKKLVNNKNIDFEKYFKTINILLWLTFSCVGSKKTAQFDKSLYDDESSEILAIDDTKTYETVSQNLIFSKYLTV